MSLSLPTLGNTRRFRLVSMRRRCVSKVLATCLGHWKVKKSNITLDDKAAECPSEKVGKEISQRHRGNPLEERGLRAQVHEPRRHSQVLRHRCSSDDEPSCALHPTTLTPSSFLKSRIYRLSVVLRHCWVKLLCASSILKL